MARAAIVRLQSLTRSHMLCLKFAALVSLGIACVWAQATTTTELSPAASSAAVSASAAAATASTCSTTSNVKGAAFDHFYQIWLENTVSPSKICFSDAGF